MPDVGLAHICLSRRDLEGMALTCPRNTDPTQLRVCGMIDEEDEGGSSHEGNTLYDRADRLCVATGGWRHCGLRGLQKDGYQRADPSTSSGRAFLSLEEEVCGSGSTRATATECSGAENGELKQLVADLSLDKQDAPGRATKKALRPAQKRPYADHLQVTYEVSEINRSSCRYMGGRDEQAGLRMRLRELAGTRVSYGYRRLHVLLEREGWQVNHKRVYRLYQQEGLSLRTKRPRMRLV